MNEIEEVSPYGQETDQWMLEDDYKEFLSWQGPKGDYTIFLTGKPKTGMSKFKKEIYWIDCKLLLDNERCLFADRVLSTGSNQLRKQLTTLYKKHGDKLFEGVIGLTISWEGEKIDRRYVVGRISTDDEMRLLAVRE